MKKEKILLVVGIIFLAAGLFLIFTEKKVSGNNLEIARNATDAYEAARMISQNNRSEVGMHLVGMFCTGFGLVLTAVGGFTFLKKK